ncbi:hypothetical protein D3C76_554130 [compost metagenome]
MSTPTREATDLELSKVYGMLDAANVELAALREELDLVNISFESNFDAAQIARAERDDLQQRLADAERRNADMTKAISDAEYRADQGKVWNGMGWTYTGLHSHGQQKVLDILRAALKPTESGASEYLESCKAADEALRIKP